MSIFLASFQIIIELRLKNVQGVSMLVNVGFKAIIATVSADVQGHKRIFRFTQEP